MDIAGTPKYYSVRRSEPTGLLYLVKAVAGDGRIQPMESLEVPIGLLGSVQSPEWAARDHRAAVTTIEASTTVQEVERSVQSPRPALIERLRL